MSKIYIIGRGHLLDDSGNKHHKGALIDFDKFTYLKDREKSFVKKGILLIPGKEQKKASQEQVKKQELQNKINELNADKKQFEKEKKEFEKIKEDFYKEVAEFNKARKEIDKNKEASGKKGGK